MLAALVATGCIDEVAARWDLDHDHVVAVRATPPQIGPGETARLDALVARRGGAVAIELPRAASAPDAPPALQAMVARVDGAWQVAAPPADVLASYGDAPIPLAVVLELPGSPRRVQKRVWLGGRADNPALPAVEVDGAPLADGAPLVVPRERDVYVSTPAPPGTRVNWLISTGALFQDDVATAFLRVAADDPATGELVVVWRAPDGGVAWRVIALRAE